MQYIDNSCLARKYINNSNPSTQSATGLLGSLSQCLRDAMSQQVRHYVVKQEPSADGCEAAGHSVLDQILFQGLLA